MGNPCNHILVCPGAPGWVYVTTKGIQVAWRLKSGANGLSFQQLVPERNRENVNGLHYLSRVRESTGAIYKGPVNAENFAML